MKMLNIFSLTDEWKNKSILVSLFISISCSYHYTKDMKKTLLRLKYNNSYVDIKDQCKTDKWGYIGTSKKNLFFFEIGDTGKIQNKFLLKKTQSSQLLCNNDIHYIIQKHDNKISAFKVGKSTHNWDYKNFNKNIVANFVQNHLVISSLDSDKNINLDTLNIEENNFLDRQITIYNDKNISLKKTLESLDTHSILLSGDEVENYDSKLFISSYNFTDRNTKYNSIKGKNGLKLNNLGKQDNGYLLIAKEINGYSSRGSTIRLDKNLDAKSSFSIQMLNSSKKLEFFDFASNGQDRYYLCGLAENLLKENFNSLIIIPITRNRFLLDYFIYSEYNISRWDRIKCDLQNNEFSISSFVNNTSIIHNFNDSILQNIHLLPPPLKHMSTKFLTYVPNILEDQENNLNVPSFSLEQSFSYINLDSNFNLNTEYFFTDSPTPSPTKGPIATSTSFLNLKEDTLNLFIIAASTIISIIFVLFVFCCWRFCTYRKDKDINLMTYEKEKSESRDTITPAEASNTVVLSNYSSTTHSSSNNQKRLIKFDKFDSGDTKALEALFFNEVNKKSSDLIPSSDLKKINEDTEFFETIYENQATDNNSDQKQEILTIINDKAAKKELELDPAQRSSHL